jgi:hypothetical protein
VCFFVGFKGCFSWFVELSVSVMMRKVFLWEKEGREPPPCPLPRRGRWERGWDIVLQTTPAPPLEKEGSKPPPNPPPKEGGENLGGGNGGVMSDE